MAADSTEGRQSDHFLAISLLIKVQLLEVKKDSMSEQ